MVMEGGDHVRVLPLSVGDAQTSLTFVLGCPTPRGSWRLVCWEAERNPRESCPQSWAWESREEALSRLRERNIFLEMEVFPRTHHP